MQLERNSDHTGKLSEVICKTVIPIALKNFADEFTERFKPVKYLNNKPINREVIILHEMS